VPHDMEERVRTCRGRRSAVRHHRDRSAERLAVLPRGSRPEGDDRAARRTDVEAHEEDGEHLLPPIARLSYEDTQKEAGDEAAIVGVEDRGVPAYVGATIRAREPRGLA